MGTDPFSDLMQDETLVTEMGRNQLKTGNEFYFRVCTRTFRATAASHNCLRSLQKKPRG